MQNQHQTRKTGVTGESGTGKSTFALRAFVNSSAQFRFGYDFEDELAQRLTQYRQSFHLCTTAEQLAEAVESYDREIILYNPDRDFGSEIETGFEFWNRWIFDISEQLPGEKLVWCDELQTFIGSQSLAGGLKDNCIRGRKRGINMMFVQSSLNLIHNSVRGQLTEIVAFRTTDPRHLEPLQDFGFDAQAINDMPFLKDGQFILRNKKTGTEISSEIILDSFA